MKLLPRSLNLKKIVLVLSLVIFTFLRLPSLFEPAWYGDEGIYAAVANEMNNGEILYTDVWDHKPPGIYLLYQLSAQFGDNQIVVYKSINFLLGVLTVLLSFLVAVQLFNKNRDAKKGFFKNINIPVILTSLGSSVYWGGTFLEGNIFNAENIFVPLMLLVFYLYLRWSKVQSKPIGVSLGKMFILGFLSGIAMFFKIQPFFDAMVVCFVLLIELIRINKGIKGLDLKKLLLSYFMFGIGLILPLFLSGIYYFVIGGLSDFIFAVFTYNLGYSAAQRELGTGFVFFEDVLVSRSVFIFIGVVIAVVLRFRKRITKETFFLLTWVAFSFFATKLSGRAYPHYFLQFLTPVLMFLAMGISKLFWEKSLYLGVLKFSVIITTLYVLLSLYSNGNPFSWGYINDSVYYQRFYGIVFEQNDYQEWTKVFNGDPEANEVLNSWLTPYENRVVYIWGTKPWVYSLAGLNSPSKYLVYFHAEDSKALVEELTESEVSVIVIEKEKELYIDQILWNYILTNFQKVETLNNSYDMYLNLGY
ncbi:hypothetical protein JW962_03240 [Candidatus Dojkabacteria bacterium]|nr:hypothetical protein [Candidatus Dojkabacteria bacterium]